MQSSRNLAQSLRRVPQESHQVVDDQEVSASSVGHLAQRLATGYYAAAAARDIVRRPGASALVPSTEPGHLVPIGRVRRLDGTEHSFDFSHFLSQASTDPEIDEALDRAWLVGALLTLGDALFSEDYFDKSPEIEMIYHLRKGVAHGNRFNITNLRRLQNHPANTFLQPRRAISERCSK